MAVVRFLTTVQMFSVVVIGIALVYVTSSTSVQAKETLPNPYDAFRLAERTADTQLPLLGDRFRIDDHVDEITMVFFRDEQSRPVVLILPDGSKWYSSRHPEGVQWETGPGFDQVRIQSPMRGPWQVSGALRQESRLMVISDLKFTAEPLPEIVFQGERLGIEGRFTEAGEPIEQRDFRNAIEMQMHLISTNQEQYENFGINPRHVGDFLDDGRGRDARARDGVFTGEISFDVPTGEYIPSYQAKTPLYQRTFEQSPILIKALPVAVEVDVATVEGRAHHLRFLINEAYIDPADLVIRGEVEFPNGEIQRVDMRTAEGDSLHTRVPNYVLGVFTVRARIYATSLTDGREVEANIGSYQFNVSPPAPPGPTEEELAAQRQTEREAAMSEHVAKERAALRQQRHMLIGVVVANLLLVIGWISFLLARRRKTLQGPSASRKKVKK